MNRKFLTCGLMMMIGVLFCTVSYGQGDSTFVKSFPNKFNMKVFGSDKILRVDLNNNDNSSVQYFPNNQGVLGVGVYMFDIGLEFAVKVPDFLQRDEKQFGVTDFTDFQGNIYGRKWCFDITYQKYKGFYINNPEVIFPDFNKTSIYPYRGDMAVKKIILNGIHIFNNDKFSFRAGYNQSERQIKSAGSLLMLTSFNRTEFKADSALLPIQIEPEYGVDAGFKQGDFSTLSFLPGYGYTYVKKYFYVNVNAAAGIGLQYQEYELDQKEQKDFVLESKVNLRASLGYDHDNFFFGAAAIYDNGSMNLQDATIQSASGNYKVFFGYRFGEFGVLKKYSIRQALEAVGL